MKRKRKTIKQLQFRKYRVKLVRRDGFYKYQEMKLNRAFTMKIVLPEISIKGGQTFAEYQNSPSFQGHDIIQREFWFSKKTKRYLEFVEQ